MKTFFIVTFLLFVAIIHAQEIKSVKVTELSKTIQERKTGKRNTGNDKAQVNPRSDPDSYRDRNSRVETRDSGFEISLRHLAAGKASATNREIRLLLLN